MKWNFWRKDNALAKLDPHGFAFIMVQQVVNRVFPFNKWRGDQPIPKQPDAFFEVSVNVYQLCILLDFLERKFGADVSETIRSHLIILMNKGKSGGVIAKFFDAVRTGRALPRREQFWAGQPKVQVDCNVARAFLNICSEPDDVKTGLYPLLGQSLTLGRISAEGCFGELVKEVSFSPVALVGLRKPQDIPIPWSEACGGFERQLQRQYQNALFPAEKRTIITADLTEAKSRDQDDYQQLLADSKKAVDEIMNGPNRTLTFNEINSWREAVENLIMRAAAVGDIANSHRDYLRTVYKGIVESLRTSCPPEHKEQLEDAFAGSERHQKTWSNQFIAQATRKDSPIKPEDVVASLLTEHVETVRLMVSTMSEDSKIKAGRTAIELIENAKKEGYLVPQAGEKLRAFNECA